MKDVCEQLNEIARKDWFVAIRTGGYRHPHGWQVVLISPKHRNPEVRVYHRYLRAAVRIAYLEWKGKK
jgi:hypothetical protein